MPAEKSRIRCMPSQMVLTPGSPSPVRAKKPPSLAIKRTTSFSVGGLSGTSSDSRCRRPSTHRVQTSVAHPSRGNFAPSASTGQCARQLPCTALTHVRCAQCGPSSFRVEIDSLIRKSSRAFNMSVLGLVGPSVACWIRSKSGPTPSNSIPAQSCAACSTTAATPTWMP